MKKHKILITILICIFLMASYMLYGVFNNGMRNYGEWEDFTKEYLSQKFLCTLPSKEIVAAFGTDYYYNYKKPTFLGDHNFVINLTIEFPSEDIYYQALSSYTDISCMVKVIHAETWYFIQYSEDHAMEYIDNEIYDGMFYDFEVIIASHEKYSIEFLCAHVWDYYQNPILVQFLQHSRKTRGRFA